MEVSNKIIQELSLWKPQRLALIKLNSTLGAIDLSQDLDTIKASLPGNLSFDTKFPSFTFDMATGTGKTRLMAACMRYLYEKGISKNFFILVPGETIYTKTINNFTKGNPKFEFSGWSDLPDFELITGENYERYDPKQLKISPRKFNIFIFNIQKIWKKQFKFYSFKETLGASFGELIKDIKDLTVLMDESHHYRGDKSFKALNELHPLIGLEFTATPKYKINGKQKTASNIIYSYSLGDAKNDGIIKRLRAVIRKNDRSYEEELEELKLIDGLNIHKRKRVQLETYCKNHNRPSIRPVTFISTKNIKHGGEIQKKIESNDFMDGEFKGKSVFVHSGSEDEQIEQLLNLEKEDSNKEIVIHVNKLKEGWDVKTIYTIIPLRASISEILVEQTMGRGVRLPFYDVTKEEIEENPEAFTLDVITYKLKGDNYRDVIKAANKNNIITKDYDEDEDKDRNLISYEVKPTNEKFKIEIPRITGKIEVTGSLKVFDIKPKYEDFKKIKAKIEGIDIIESKSKDMGEGTQTIIENQIAFLISKLIDDVDEVSFRDKNAVRGIVEKYLEKAAGTSKKENWADLLKMHRKVIFDDLKTQIQNRVNELIKVKYDVEVENFEFKPYFTIIDGDNGVKDKGSIINEEVKRTVVIGYEKSLFTENKFDSRQEKWFADIADRDKEVRRWLRNPRKQMTIRYKFGGYDPDFIVQTDKEFLLVEVKARKEVFQPDNNMDPTVQDKAREAIKWCAKAAEVTGKKWNYKLIPHDKINRQDSFKAVISNAVKIN